jgi:hypothetical protein
MQKETSVILRNCEGEKITQQKTDDHGRAVIEQIIETDSRKSGVVEG